MVLLSQKSNGKLIPLSEGQDLMDVVLKLAIDRRKSKEKKRKLSTHVVEKYNEYGMVLHEWGVGYLDEMFVRCADINFGLKVLCDKVPIFDGMYSDLVGFRKSVSDVYAEVRLMAWVGDGKYVISVTGGRFAEELMCFVIGGPCEYVRVSYVKEE